MNQNQAQRIKQTTLTRTANTQRRNKDIRNKFDKLYTESRLRYDDCIKQIAYEFYLTTRVVERVLSQTQI